MLEINKIHNIDCFDGMDLLDDESVDCVITSPPYWALRDYDSDSQLGLEKEADDFVEKLIELFDKIHRTLKPTGTCWVNIGDTFAGSGKGAWDGRNEETDRSKESFTFDKKPDIEEDVNPKSLMMIPERFALSMIKSRKWTLRNQIIWYKPNVKPETIKDRYTRDYEPTFFFVKNRKYYFKQQTELGVNGEPRNQRTVWAIKTGQYKGTHTAVFPPELVRRPIDAGCPEYGLVLDQFMGSGTTSAIAKEMGRDFIGFEINPNYILLAEKRLKETKVNIESKTIADGIFPD